MAYTGQDIIKAVTKNYPPTNSAIHNGTDLAMTVGYSFFNQYILGLTEADRFTGDISSYQHWMGQQLKGINGQYDCLAYRFSGAEFDELIQSLREVAGYFNIDADIERMLRKANVKKEDGKYYYIVVTVVQYPVVMCE